MRFRSVARGSLDWCIGSKPPQTSLCAFAPYQAVEVQLVRSGSTHRLRVLCAPCKPSGTDTVRRCGDHGSLHRVVIARHYCYPIGKIPREADVAFGNWYMFFNAAAIVRQRGGDPTVSEVVQALRDSEEPGGPQEYVVEPETEWNINELSFVVGQRGQDTGVADAGSSRLEGARGGG